MKCPTCGADTRVVDSRQRGARRIRRRWCPQCCGRFSTTEVVGLAALPLLRRRVRKKDGAVEEFDAQKLQKSVAVAVRKPRLKDISLESVVEAVEQEIADDDQPIDSKRIGVIVLAHLKTRDAMAYIRYASVHQEINTMEDFSAMLKKLRENGRQ